MSRTGFFAALTLAPAVMPAAGRALQDQRSRSRWRSARSTSRAPQSHRGHARPVGVMQRWRCPVQQTSDGVVASETSHDVLFCDNF
ncbi:MAG: hypothetical protein H0X12_18045 [Nocardioides sp.]|nr:hypothetical protein [Nocardioides sp.]